MVSSMREHSMGLHIRLRSICAASDNAFSVTSSVVWRYDGERIRMLALAGDSYVEREQSLAFTALRSPHLTELLAASQQMPRTVWLRHVRAWAQASTRSPQA
jgi:hypothetical protein